MSGDKNGTRAPLASQVADRHLLDRDQLLDLVEELHTLVTSQQRTIERQRTAITRLQSRPDANAPPAAPQSQAPPRQLARLVAGSDFTIVFDGGAIGNPGKGYGSYQIVGPAGVVSEASPQYGGNITNNQAEFMTLIRALQDLQDRLGEATARTTVAIRGDSQLVLNTLSGRWKVRHPGLIPLHQQATSMLNSFGAVDSQWQPRSKSVAILGH